MNKVFLIGRLTSDPTLNQINDKLTVARATVAVEREKSQNQITDFIPITCWNNTATFISRYVPKGTLIAVEGSYTTGRYTNQSNQVVYTNEVTVENIKILEPKSVIEDRLRKEGRDFTQSFPLQNETNINSAPSFKKNYDSNTTNNNNDEDFDQFDIDNSDLN